MEYISYMEYSHGGWGIVEGEKGSTLEFKGTVHHFFSLLKSHILGYELKALRKHLICNFKSNDPFPTIYLGSTDLKKNKKYCYPLQLTQINSVELCQLSNSCLPRISTFIIPTL